MALLATLGAKLLTTPIIGALVNPLVNGALERYKARLSSEESKAKIAAELAQRELALDQREAEVNADTVKNEQGNFLTRMVRPLWAAPFIVYAWKVVVWDKVVGSLAGMAGNCPGGPCDGQGSPFVTDPILGVMGTLMVTIAGAYFGFRGLQYVIREFGKT